MPFFFAKKLFTNYLLTKQEKWTLLKVEIRSIDLVSELMELRCLCFSKELRKIEKKSQF